ncbi:MAG: galactosyltransferase-related protein [Flavobacteriaceae bacterium]|nr:galactosyltransferase-related protein [Flavobacteriaceae bacterium]
MLTILYVYKDKDCVRLEHSLQSLKHQTFDDFKVILVDYGSNKKFSDELQKTIKKFNFVKVISSYNSNQIWSRAKALNIGIKALDISTDYVFTADIDMIFSENFVEKLTSLKKDNLAFFFKVGFLNQEESSCAKSFKDYKVSFASDVGAQGLSLFPLKALQEVGGFDEFFHFWGAEDTDLHNRLALAGYQIEFYNREILMLHQWHPSYRSLEQNRLTLSPRLSNIARLNHQHLQHNLTHKIIHPNAENWGKVVTKKQTEKLENYPETLQLSNKKEVVDHFLFVALPNHKDGILSVSFSEDVFKNTLKYKLKKWLGKPVPHYYSLKEINDALLLHIISFYRDFPYYYKVSEDLRSINFKIIKD